MDFGRSICSSPTSREVSKRLKMQTRRRKYNEEDKATAELAVEKGKAAKTARLRMPQFQHLVSVFVLFSISRLISALFNNINDCDETFNYWEPAHFLLYGNGFQTWEYSPEYAIRSYFYIWLYVIPASVATFLGLDKMSAFYLTRFILAFFSALVETFFYRFVCQFDSTTTYKVYIQIVTVSSREHSTTRLPYFTVCSLCLLLECSTLQHHFSQVHSARLWSLWQSDFG